MQPRGKPASKELDKVECMLSPCPTIRLSWCHTTTTQKKARSKNRVATKLNKLSPLRPSCMGADSLDVGQCEIVPSKPILCGKNPASPIVAAMAQCSPALGDHQKLLACSMYAALLDCGPGWGKRKSSYKLSRRAYMTSRYIQKSLQPRPSPPT